MPRVQFSDVTPPGKRSIRNIPIPKNGRRKVPIVIKPEKTQTLKEEPAVSDYEIKLSDTADTTEKKNSGTYEYYYPGEKTAPESNKSINKTGRKKTWIFGGIAAVLIVIFIASMMTVFASATITINPKNQDISVDTKITGVATATANAVRYEVIELTDSKTLSVPATGEQDVELKASGKIMVYNNFSTEPQRLINRTRFQTSDGLIFRIADSIVVPGKTIKNGVSTPGSLEVTVFADEAGNKYNIKKTDFTIPGFKSDTERFQNFYARSSTDMTGGFIGKQKTVLPADKKTALQSVEAETEAGLKKNLGSKVPDGLVLLSDSIVYKTVELPQKEDGSAVILGEEITAYAFMLNKQDLVNELIDEYIASSSDWNKIKATIKDFSLLNVSGLPDNPEAGNKINLQITGKVKVSADIDTNLISQKLLGVPKGTAGKLMDEFPGISSITAAIRPVWKQSFPKNPSKIYVQIAPNN